MAMLWANNASTSVSGSIAATDTTVQLAAGTGILFPQPTGGNYYVATFYDQATKTRNEIVHVTAMSGDVATIVRGQEGTTPQAWFFGDIYANLITAGTLANFVQVGTGPINTEFVYVGTDVGTINHIVATTNPSFTGGYAIGMLFNILVKNTNSGAVDVQLNGLAALPLTRNNNAPLVGGDITGTMEVTFVYNGVGFNTMIPDLKQHPPVTTFYVRADGNDNNTGWANTPQDAFATVYGAINNISNRYSSQNAIQIRVADGYYIGGFGIYNGYVAEWIIVGNTTNPQNCVIDATATSWPGGSAGPNAVAIEGATSVSIQGFMFRSFYQNAICVAGTTEFQNIYWTAPVTTVGGFRQSVITSTGGQTNIASNHTYDPVGRAIGYIFSCGEGGGIQIGESDPIFGNATCVFDILNSPQVSATVGIDGNALVLIDFNATTFIGTIPQGQQYQVINGGGLSTNGNLAQVPGSVAGAYYAPAWVD